MGIKNFSQTFKPIKTINFKDIKNTRIAFDIMSELWRASLGTKNIKTLTDKNGNSTVHISVMLANIIQLAKNKVEIIGCFDYNKKSDETYHNPIKYDEIKKRQIIKDKAKKKLEEDKLISDDEEEIDEEKKLSNLKEKLDTDKKNMLEKQAFTVNSEMINDIKFIFDCLNIKYLEAPKTFEGEYMCSYLEKNDFVNGCFSNDTDLIAFGCKTFYRRNPRDKKIYIYTQDNILEQIGENKNINDIRKIAVILGCDFCDKTNKIGPKTVFKKYQNIELNEKQLKAFDYYSKELDNNIEINNTDKIQFIDCKKNILIDWLVSEKSFNRDRITKQLEDIN